MHNLEKYQDMLIYSNYGSFNYSTLKTNQLKIGKINRKEWSIFSFCRYTRNTDSDSIYNYSVCLGHTKNTDSDNKNKEKVVKVDEVS